MGNCDLTVEHVLHRLSPVAVSVRPVKGPLRLAGLMAVKRLRAGRLTDNDAKTGYQTRQINPFR
jgi:hypothetical protein